MTEATTALLRRSGRSRSRERSAEQDEGQEYDGSRGLSREMPPPDSADELPPPDPAEATPGGMSVADLLAHRPEYWRRVAKVGISVASALSYSHQEGILHRDIKPSNVLLDRRGIVWVADFGLAKHEGHQSVTSVGDIVGTIRYMAPEQFSGRADARSDIHSLGLMLHEQLTLRPAFPEERHGPLIRQKMAAPPPPPRTLVPHVPADLETIVRKACAVNPADRYQNAAEMEADLKRFLDGHPIHARRVSLAERGWRWARRNPLSAVLSTWLALLVLAGVVLFAVGKHRTDAALEQLAREQDRVAAKTAQASAADARTAQNVELAVEALEGVMRNLASRGVPTRYASRPASTPSAVSPDDVALLEELMSRLDLLADQSGTDLGLALTRGRHCVADLLAKLGKLAAADCHYGSAIKSCGRAADGGQVASAFLADWARAWNARGDVLRRQGDLVGARKAHATARDVLDTAGAAPSAAIRFERARALVSAAALPPAAAEEASPDTHASQATTDCKRALELLAVVLFEEPNNLDYRLALARAQQTYARCALRSGQSPEAIAAIQAAVEQLDRIATDFGNPPSLVYELADVLRTTVGRQVDYARRVARATTLSEGLAKDWPAIPEYRVLAGECLAQQGAIHLSAGDVAQARAKYEKSAGCLQQVAKRHKESVPLQVSYAGVLAALAEIHLRGTRPAAARPLIDQAEARLGALPQVGRESPDVREVQARLARIRARLPDPR